MNRGWVSDWLRRLSKRAIGREVFPYLLRHSRATELYINAGIPDKVAQKFLGHSKDMSDVYTHLSNKDVKEALGKTIYKLDEIPEERKHELVTEIESLKSENEIIKDRLRRISEDSERMAIVMDEIKEMFNPNDLKNVKVVVRGVKKT